MEPGCPWKQSGYRSLLVCYLPKVVALSAANGPLFHQGPQSLGPCSFAAVPRHFAVRWTVFKGEPYRWAKRRSEAGGERSAGRSPCMWQRGSVFNIDLRPPACGRAVGRVEPFTPTSPEDPSARNLLLLKRTPGTPPFEGGQIAPHCIS